MNRRISYTGYSLSTFFEGGRCGVPRGESPPLAERGRDLVLDGARVEEHEAARLGGQLEVGRPPPGRVRARRPQAEGAPVPAGLPGPALRVQVQEGGHLPVAHAQARRALSVLGGPGEALVVVGVPRVGRPVGPVARELQQRRGRQAPPEDLGQGGQRPGGRQGHRRDRFLRGRSPPPARAYPPGARGSRTSTAMESVRPSAAWPGTGRRAPAASSARAPHSATATAPPGSAPSATANPAPRSAGRSLPPP